MAFNSQDLSVLAYANGFTLWHYTTPDDATAVGNDGYFNEAADMLRNGDIVMANVDNDGIRQAGLFLVNIGSAGHVDVSDMTRIGATG